MMRKLLLIILWLPILPCSGLAETTFDKPADVRILIDVSGSMKQNDPRNLRRPALDLLLNLIPEDSRAGVWTFGRYVNMLIPHAVVDESWREKAEPQSALINSVALHTNIGMALEKANYDADPQLFPSSLNYAKSVLLLTDGVVDIDSDPSVNNNERNRILGELLESYKRAGVVIHTVALSTNADAELLEQLAQDSTGSFAVAEEASDLNRIFLNALDRAVPAEQVPLENNRFFIDSSIEEFTALAFRKPGSAATTLISPAGDKYAANDKGASIRWLQSDEYDLITIKQPVEGEWQLNTELDPDNRVSIVSNLSVDISPIESSVFVDEHMSLEVQLSQNNKPIIDDHFLDLITVKATVERVSNDSPEFMFEQLLSRDDSKTSQYKASIAHDWSAGESSLNIIVDGKTFKRKKSIKLKTADSFTARAEYKKENNQIIIVINVINPAWQTEALQLSGQASLTSSDDMTPLHFEKLANNEWQALFTPTENGSYHFALHARGLEKNSQLKPLTIDIDNPAILAVEPTLTVLEPVVEPVIETLPVEAVEEPVTTEKTQSEFMPEPVNEQLDEPDGLNLPLLIGALVLGNIVMGGGLYLLYRKMTRPNSEVLEGEAEVETEGAAVLEKEPSLEGESLDAEETPNTESSLDADETGADQTKELKQEADDETVEDVLAEIDEIDVGLETEPDSERVAETEEPAKAAVIPETSTAEAFDIDNELDQLIDELGDDLSSELDEESLDNDIDNDAEVEVSFSDDEAAPELTKDKAISTEKTDAVDSEDDEVTLDFDGEFDLSTDISDELKKQSS